MQQSLHPKFLKDETWDTDESYKSALTIHAGESRWEIDMRQERLNYQPPSILLDHPTAVTGSVGESELILAGSFGKQTTIGHLRLMLPSS